MATIIMLDSGRASEVRPVRNEGLIGQLRRELERAERGELMSGAFVATTSRSDEATVRWYRPSAGSCLGTLALLRILAREIEDGVIADSEPSDDVG